jgi:hypothetical protein
MASHHELSASRVPAYPGVIGSLAALRVAAASPRQIGWQDGHYRITSVECRPLDAALGKRPDLSNNES